MGLVGGLLSARSRTLLDRAFVSCLIMGSRCGDQVVEASIGLAHSVTAVLFARADAARQEGWIYVAKLLRAHGGCLGVRRL